MMDVIEAMAGESLSRVVQRTLDHCHKTGQPCECRHNGISVRVYAGSHEYDIHDKFELKRKLSVFTDWK